MNPTETCSDDTKTQARPKRSRLGGPWWADVPLVVAALMAVNAVASPDDMGFRNVNPNPYFAAVLYLALRHGTAAGFAAGLLCAAIHLVPRAPFDLEGPFLLTPGLFVVVGLVVGEMVQQDRERLGWYRSLTERLENDREAARKTAAAKDAVIRALQRRIEDHALS